MKNTVFEFEKKRDFGSVISDSLQFFTRNFKSFLLGFLMYIGPFFLAGALAMIYAGMQLQASFRNDLPGYEMLASMLVFIPFVLISTIMMVAFVTGMVQKHQQGGTPPLVEGIWPYIRKNFWPVMVTYLMMFVLILIPFGLLILLAYTIGTEIGIAIAIFLSLPVLFYITVPLSMFMIAHVMEGNPVGISLRRGFYLVRDKWWNTFGVYIVISILASIASYIFMIPAYVIFFVKSLASLGSGEMDAGFGMWFGIMYACGFLGSLFAGMYQILGMILQYFSLREQKEGTGLMRRIQEVDKPATESYV